MSKKGLTYLLFFVVLVGGFYAALVTFTDFEKVKLPVLNTVQPFTFLRQDSTVVSQKDLKKRIYVAEYFFTTCKGICPKMNDQMTRVAAAFRGQNDVAILSHTVDPETDTVAQMKRIAADFEKVGR